MSNSAQTAAGYFIILSESRELKMCMTLGYKGKRKTVIRVLNDALATKVMSLLRYKGRYF